MDRSRIVLALAAFALVTAGCIGTTDTTGDDEAGPTADDANATDDETTDAGPALANDEPAGPIVHELDETLTVEAANLGADDAERSIEVPVPADAEAVVAELRWEGTADLDLALWSPQFCEEPPAPDPPGGLVCLGRFYLTGENDHAYGTDRASPAVQDSELAVRVDAPTIRQEACEMPPCDWVAHVNPNAAVETAFQLRVSVFPDQTPEDGYSAFDEA